ncbi:MAG: glutaminase A [Rivularia sp. (in: Bacteria)]|nr:glutaminase A [Rivularia sp. MS3]
MTDIKNFSELNASDKGITPALTSFLEDLYCFYQPLNEGKVAQNIPELAKANPDWFGICAVGVDGKVFDIGHTTQEFSIQSISKPFVYGLALEDWGKDYVLGRIGVEPTGEPFNSIMEPEEIFRRHYNPMVNAGAIVTTSLIKGADARKRYNRLLEMFRRYIGRNVSIDAGVFNSKKTSDHLNRAIAYMMLNFDLIEGNINDILNLYFQQCSLTVNCHDLAVMAATLANKGLNPMTEEQAIDQKYVKNILSIMYTCGLYEFSGQWAYKVGLPAKSGLSGAIIGVVPNQMGIAVFSPPLDKRKKSWRGVKVFEALSEKFGLHIFTTDNQEVCPQSQRKIHFVDAASQQNLTQSNVKIQYNLPSKSLITFLRELHCKYLPLRDGKAYVSEAGLVDVNPDWFAICIATVDGQVYCVGDWEESFLIQSISKVFAYGLALEDKGREYVLTKVDVEPTGDAYNSIIKVESKSKRPYNSMVNTGAIATTSLIEGAGPGHKLNRILEMYRRYIGRRVFVDTPILVSEQNSGDRNWAISYLLRNFGMISGDISQTLHLYLQQCSVIINCRDLALMGATLANNGINPVTKERAINSIFVKDLLSVMQTCGMYDFAGEWVYKVGFPAKSGVGGGIIGVVPNQMGIAVFSPPLDSRGNSIRGIKVCEELSKYLGLHIFAR